MLCVDNLFLYISKQLKFEKFPRCFLLTWVFIVTGLMVFVLFQFLAGLMPRAGFFALFLQFMGIFLLFTSLLMAYAGVYAITTAPQDVAGITRAAIVATVRRSYMILGVSFLTLFVYVAFLLLQVGVSSIAIIPYVGPVVIALFTAPLLLVNLAGLIAVIIVFAVFPPLASEVRTMRDLFLEFKISVQGRWLKVALYTLVSFALLVLCVLCIYYLLMYVAGISRAVQGSIITAYPSLMDTLAMKSAVAEAIRELAPRGSSIASMREARILFTDLHGVLSFLVGLSYLVLLSAVMAFPLAAYFNLSSIFFGRVKR